ncbi:MAG: lipoprotein [Azoarcus sp.]|jgi:predicted small lipoprotein YifL|nr:lipoprotein [Azoarcus sp.]
MRAMTTLAAIACALSVPACGIKGPLYLPSPPSVPASQAAAPAAHDDRNNANDDASVPKAVPAPENLQP